MLQGCEGPEGPQGAELWGVPRDAGGVGMLQGGQRARDPCLQSPSLLQCWYGVSRGELPAWPVGLTPPAPWGPVTASP